VVFRGFQGHVFFPPKNNVASFEKKMSIYRQAVYVTKERWLSLLFVGIL